jgi:hypothetical protein
MMKFRSVALMTGISAAVLSAIAWAGTPAAPDRVTLEQGVDQATLTRYHHTDQGTRIMPAAFLQALKTADGKSQLMSADNMRDWGFIVDGETAGTLNPFGWPVGFTVSDPKVSSGIPVAGITCAACHTGQLDYKGTHVRIEGGQGNPDLSAFQMEVFAAIGATAKDPARRAQFLKDAVAAGYPAASVDADFRTLTETADQLLYGQKGLKGVVPGNGRVDAVQGIANAVLAKDIQVPSNAKNFDAPVNFPYLWDIWRLSWLQYNGFLPPQADSRNIGEVLGVSGKTNVVDPKTGALNPEPARWWTSVQLKNLQWMEATLKHLKAPSWPASVFGAVDETKAARGRELFSQNCAGCHGIKVLPNHLWDVSIVSLSHVGTDPNQAVDWAGRTYDASKLGLGEVRATALSGLINNIRTYLYDADKTPASQREPDVKFEAPCGYKARPLIGVWATPPFLHNGSVRTVYDLLSDTRPTSFRYGSSEFDPVHLGYTEDNAPGSRVLDTTISGNHNTGHWWTDDINRPGRIGRKLTEDEKSALIEYLKAASYDNYPMVQVEKPRELPCADNPDWASKL